MLFLQRLRRREIMIGIKQACYRTKLCIVE
jgi:hypothetical protein